MLGWMQILSQPNTKTVTKFNHTCTFALIALIVASAGLHILNWLLARFTGWHAFSRQIVDRHPFYDAKGLAVKLLHVQLCRLIWVCVPMCLLGVLLTAQPSAIFGSSASSLAISPIAVGVGVTQVIT